MTLLEYVKNELKNGTELFHDEKVITKNNVALTRDTRILRQMCLGAISTDNSHEFYLVCRLHCPVGTVIEDYDETKWAPVYDEYVAMCRVELTKALMDERNAKSAAILLKILEKRDRNHWGDKREVSVAGDDGQAISISIVGV